MKKSLKTQLETWRKRLLKKQDSKKFTRIDQLNLDFLNDRLGL